MLMRFRLPACFSKTGFRFSGRLSRTQFTHFTIIIVIYTPRPRQHALTLLDYFHIYAFFRVLYRHAIDFRISRHYTFGLADSEDKLEVF